MKNFKIVFFALSVFAFSVSCTKQNEEVSKMKQDKFLPQPTNSEFILENHKKVQEREAWINAMHKAAPDVNWRLMDAETRYKKMQDYANKNISDYVYIEDGTLKGTWRETGSSNQAGRTHWIEYDPEQDSIYCASDGGNIWKADKEGNGWRCVNNYFKFSDIKTLQRITYNGNDRLLVCNGGWGVPGFYYSDNDGVSYQQSYGLQNPTAWGYIKKSFAIGNDNPKIYVLALEWDNDDWNQASTLYSSVNGGLFFYEKQHFSEATYGSEGRFDIWADYYFHDTLYLIENDNLYYLDGSDQLVLQGTIPNDPSGNVLLSGTKLDGITHLYAAYNENDNTDFYYSENAGIDWVYRGSAPTGPFFNTSFSVSSVDPNTLYYGGVNCYKSQDGGQTWEILNEWYDYYGSEDDMLHADIPSINSFRDSIGNELCYINTDGGTYISYDQLENVQNISLDGLNISQYYSTYTNKVDPNYIYIGSQDQGYQWTNADDGSSVLNFEQIISGDYGHIVSSNDGESTWMVYPGYAVYYPNARTNPNNSTWWEFTCSGNHWIPPLMPDPDQPNICYLGGGAISSGTNIIKLTNSGSISAEELAFDFTGSSGSAAISALNYSKINTDYRYVINDAGDFFVSTDGGSSWQETDAFDGPDGDYLYGSTILPSPTQLGHVYVGGSGYSNPAVYKSEDNGATFSNISSTLPNTMVYELVCDPEGQFVFAATEVGPYVYIVESNHWYDLSQGMAPDQIYWTVDYIAETKTARFGTYGRGLWDFKIDEALETKKSYDINYDISLYPNPASNYINVVSSVAKEINYNISDLQGKMIQEGMLNSSKRINIESLKAGIYILNIIEGKQFISKTFIKK
jgi:photosystem II stability/assembly factor-like uncharacterized protein